MTLAEAKAALGADAVVDGIDQYPIRLHMDNVQIGSRKGTVSLYTKDNSDLVNSVTLGPEISSSLQDFSASIVFDDLKVMLIDKYGQPISYGKQPDPLGGRSSVMTTVVWSFPSTIITLTMFSDAQRHKGSVTVNYRQADKKALGTL